MSIFFRGNLFLLWSIFIFLPTCYISGQAPISLAQLIDSASGHMPSLMQKQAVINSAEAGITDARHSFIPAVRVNVQSGIGTDNSLPGSYNSFGIIPSTSSGVRIQSNMQSAVGSIGILHGEYELLDFGYRKATISRARSYLGLQEADLYRSLYLLKTEIARLYFDLIKGETQLKIDSQNIQRYQHIFEVIHALTMSGLKPGADSSLAKAELSKSIVSCNITAGTIDQLKELLSYYTGISAIRIRIDTIVLQNNALSHSLYVDTGLSVSNPLINYFKKQQELFANNEKWIAKSFLPKIFLIANAWARGSSISPADQYQALSNGLSFQRYNYLAGFTIQYDLFNGLHKYDKLKINHFQTESANFELQQRQLELQSAGNQADLSVRTYETNLKELIVQIIAARSTYDQKIAQYKAGIISLIDLTNAAFVLYRSLNDYTETLSDWFKAHLDKAASNGSLDNFIKSIN